ncbi:MAG: HD domain-containing protein [Bacteroidales bacterium]|nr:HD domain-containing protein [Bacteroidales bacterium]
MKPAPQYSLFALKPEYFDHQSALHGIHHTYRVMYHCLLLGRLTRLHEQGMLAFFGAFIHDMARRHDGYCTEHGMWAATHKLPLFLELFRRHGITAEDEEQIRTAVTRHSLTQELNSSAPHYQVTALLKDADALDRVRLGPGNLDTSYFRFRETHDLRDFAGTLLSLSENKHFRDFSEFVKQVDRFSPIPLAPEE